MNIHMSWGSLANITTEIRLKFFNYWLVPSTQSLLRIVWYNDIRVNSQALSCEIGGLNSSALITPCGAVGADEISYSFSQVGKRERNSDSSWSTNISNRTSSHSSNRSSISSSSSISISRKDEACRITYDLPPFWSWILSAIGDYALPFFYSHLFVFTNSTQIHH